MIMNAATKRTIGKLFSGVLRLARGTSLLLGLAVMLALSTGVASSALAGTGVGGVFNLGQANTVNTISRLVGSVDNAMLRVTNSNAGASATALDLRVTANKPPMTVNSETNVANLNADQLDGNDSTSFMQESELNVRSEAMTVPVNDYKTQYIECAGGDLATGGGFDGLGSNTKVLYSRPSDGGPHSWIVSFQNTGSYDDTVYGWVVCV
jgi:hypothetical protein